MLIRCILILHLILLNEIVSSSNAIECDQPIFPSSQLIIDPQNIIADADDLIFVQFKWINLLKLKNNLTVDLILPHIAEPVKNLSCTQNLFIVHDGKKKFSIQGVVTVEVICSIYIKVVNSIVPNQKYLINVTAFYRNITSDPCILYVFNQTTIKSPQLTVLSHTIDNLTSIEAAENFNVRVTLKIPEVKLDLNVSVIYAESEITRSNSFMSASILQFFNRSLSYMINSSHASGIAPVVVNKNALEIDFGDVIQNYTSIVTYTSINFTIPIKVINDSITISGREGFIIVNTGFSNLSLPVKFSGLLVHPELDIQKTSVVVNKEGTEVKTSLFVKHLLNSKYDAYGIVLQDYIEGMYVLRQQSDPLHVIYSNLTKVVNRWYVNGYIQKLKVGESAKLTYTSRFSQATKVESSSSKASLFWKSGQANSPVYGPIYSDLECIVKAVKYEESFIPNYGYIILGIVVGVVVGAMIAALILICMKRYPATKKYVLHVDEDDETNNMEKKSLTMSKPVYQDMEKGEEGIAENKTARNGFFNRFAIRKPVDKQQYQQPDLSNFWCPDVLKDDAFSVHEKLNGLDGKNHVTLLEFSISLFIDAWITSIKVAHEKVYSNNDMKIQVYNESKKELVKKLQTFYDLNLINTSENSNTCLLKASETIFDVYSKGADAFEGILMKIEKKDTRIGQNNRTKLTDKELIKKQKELEDQHEEKLNEYRKELNSMFTQCFNNWLDCCHHITGVTLEEKLDSVSYALSLVFYQQLFSFIQPWVKKSVMKQMDALKRKRILSEQVDAEFEETFLYELDQVMAYLENAKLKVAIKEERRSSTLYAELRKRMHYHYRAVIKNIKEGKSVDKNEEEKPVSATEKHWLEIFEVCFEYAEVSRKNSRERKEGLLAMHQNHINLINQTLTVFLTRMQSHAQDIYRTKVEIPDIATDNESLHAEPIEMRQPSEVNYLENIIQDLQLTLQELVTNLSFFEIEKRAFLKKQRGLFQEWFDNSIMKRKSEVNHVMLKCHILLKSTIQSLGPMSWTDTEKWITVAPKFCITAVAKRFIRTDILSELRYNEYYERLKMEEKDVFNYWSVLKKCEILNDVNNHVIEEMYHVTQELLSHQSTNETEYATKGHFSTVLQQNKELLAQEQLVKLTGNFLLEVMQEFETSNTDPSKEIGETITNFVKSMKSIQKLTSQTMTEEGENNIKEQLRKKLKMHMTTCEYLVASTNHEFLSKVAFNIEKITDHLFELGREHQKMEDKTSTARRILTENYQMIGELYKKNELSEDQLLSLLKDISLRVSPPEVDAVSKLLFGDTNSKSFKHIFKYLISMENDKKTSKQPRADQVNNTRQRKRVSVKKKNSIADSRSGSSIA